MFYAKEEKANFMLENQSQPNVRHFLTDTVKVQLYACENVCEFEKNWPLNKLMRFVYQED